MDKEIEDTYSLFNVTQLYPDQGALVSMGDDIAGLACAFSIRFLRS